MTRLLPKLLAGMLRDLRGGRRWAWTVALALTVLVAARVGEGHVIAASPQGDHAITQEKPPALDSSAVPVPIPTSENPAATPPDAQSLDDAGLELGERWPLLAISTILTLAVVVVAVRRGWLRLPAHPSQAGPVPVDTAAWFLGLFLLQILAPMIPVMALRGAIDTDTLGGRALLQWLSYAAQLPFAIAIVARSVRPSEQPMVTTSRPLLAGVIGLVCIAPIIVLGSQLAAIIQQLVTGITPPQLGHETLRAIVEQQSNPTAWLVIAAVTIGAPVFEEIAYRGGLHGAMRALDIKPWATILLTSAFFTIMHLGAIPTAAAASALTGLAFLSIALGLLRERTGGVLAPIIAHALFNMANIALAWQGSRAM
ncbi:MAG: CPBP family intramembrane metalloprotease [Phycisphaerae bacterium]|nr:CPBP family intramembrane metalloprotease [Phycisphaerae bacterium]